MALQKKNICDYVKPRPKLVSVPSRISEDTLKKTQESAKKLGVTLRDYIESAMRMANDQADKA